MPKSTARRRPILILVLAGAIAAHAGSILHSQDTTTPTFRTDANYVRVDVYATRDGKPVTDLRAEDFELREEGEPQRIEQFEYVNIHTTAPSIVSQEPASVEQSRHPISDARARVIVLFLDSAHVDDASTARIQRPLLTMLRGMLTDEDLIAVMTPDMSARDLAFTHRTELLENILERHPFWGESDRMRTPDPAEAMFNHCYAGRAAIVQELIARRRAKRTFDSLRELVAHLRDLREERKTIITVTSGWRLFRPDIRIDSAGTDGVPPYPLPPFDPRGRPTTELTGGATTEDLCLRTRMELAGMDFERDFRDVIAAANRANASFYPVDPGGLRTTPESSRAGRDTQPGGGTHAFESGNPASNLRELAVETDGKTTIGTNMLTEVLRAALTDASSYYLLGYQSTRPQDGKYHSISVRSRRAGVSIRARKGYLASRAPVAAPKGAPASTADAMRTSATRAALDALTAATRDLPARANVVVSRGASASIAPRFSVVAQAANGAAAGRVEVTIATPDGETVATGRAPLAGGTASLEIASQPPASPGASYIAHIRIESGGLSETLTQAVTVRPTTGGSGALYFRRRGAQESATADLRFRRTEALRVEIPARADAGARLLDRTGAAINVPVQSASRVEDDGSQWTTVRPPLASLAPGDYLIEITHGGEQVLLPFRMVP